MKRIVGIFVLILLIYVIYYDLSKGTLSFVQASNEKSETAIEVTQEIPYFEKEVESGDTLISVVEGSLNSSVPVSIEMVIEDFKTLNDGLNPQEIQYGKTYKFPDYHDELEE